jgi:hypothetical protein
MAHFYGTLNGTKGEATRCGDKRNGLTTYAASYSGAIKTTLYVDAQGRDCFRVTEEKWQGSGQYRPIAEGVLGGVKTPGKYDTVGVYAGMEVEL